MVESGAMPPTMPTVFISLDCPIGFSLSLWIPIDKLKFVGQFIPRWCRRERSPSRTPRSRCRSPHKSPPSATGCQFPQIAKLRVAKQTRPPGCKGWLSKRRHFSPGLDLDIPDVTGVVQTQTQVFLHHWIPRRGQTCSALVGWMILVNRDELEKWTGNSSDLSLCFIIDID